MDIEVKAYNGIEELTLPPESLSGDLFGVVGMGVRKIVWDPTIGDYDNRLILPDFRIELSAKVAPLYMIIDLTKNPGEEGQIEYVFQDALMAGDWGTWEQNPVTNDGEVIKSVIWTGVTNDIAYKTTKLVLRHVPAGSTEIISSDTKESVTAILTRSYYAGVFEVTQKQWLLIKGGNNPAHFKGHASFEARPVEKVGTIAIRGTKASYGWPDFGHSVDKDSFIGKLRNKTGLEGFDLPTDAQWDRACRAGTTTTFNDGDASVPYTISQSMTTNENLNVLGRYEFNGGKTWVWDAGNEVYKWDTPPSDCDPSLGTAIVGSYKPNAWGFYDMHGNVFEWVLNQAMDASTGVNISGGVDPEGMTDGTNQMARGGSRGHPPFRSAISMHHVYAYDGKYETLGLRVFLNQ